MQDSDATTERCLQLARLLNAEREWGVAGPALRRYTISIAASVANCEEITDLTLCVQLQNYHADHTLVAALRDASHPEHTERWEDWTRQAVRILASKTAGGRGLGEAIVSLEDLAQEAMHDLWRGLPRFSYQSRFHTWAFTVIGHCLSRHYRAQKTSKRGALPPAHSLDALLEDGASFEHPAAPLPDTAVLSAMLAELVEQVLRRHPDERVAAVFHLCTTEDKTLRVIGEALALSPARVYALHQQALALLRSEQAIQEWEAEGRAREVVA